MENLLKELEIIENEHKDFIEANNIKLSQYISISRRPVMIRFNHKAENANRLPKELYERIDKLIMGYYGI